MMKKLLLILLLLIAGCTQQNYQNNIVSINQYFNTSINNYTETLIESNINCLNGSCPSHELNKLSVKDCFFCNSEYNGIKGDNFKVSIGVTGGADSFAGCTTTYLHNEISGEYPIITMNNTHLIVEIIKTGTVEKTGSCETTYEYEYEDTYKWIFEK